MIPGGVPPPVDRAMDNDIHLMALARAESEDDRRALILSHYRQRAADVGASPKSALLEAQTRGSARIYGILGGQGNNRYYFDELRALYGTYRPIVQDLVEAASELLQSLARDERVSDQYPYGLDVLGWLRAAEATPSVDELIAAPVSFPIIGLLQLAQIKALLAGLDCSPADLPAVFQGLTGHSQGVVVAAAVATTTTWSDFHVAALNAVQILFWVGARCQQSFAENPLSREQQDQLEKNGHGAASPMLSVQNISKEHLQRCIATVNKYLRPESHVSISLVNSGRAFVVSGPQRSLFALVDFLGSTAAGDAQSRVPFSQRKPSPTTRFLPITIPCHCPLLDDAASVIEDDLRHIRIAPAALRLPVNRDHDGLEVNSYLTDDLVPTLVRLITSEVVNWPANEFPHATHLVDLGPGGTSGVGALTHRNDAGSGVRVILAGKLELAGGSEFGAVSELFDRDSASVRWGSNWERDHAVSLVRTEAGVTVDSKLSRLLGLPPFFVAGMTPTTTHPEFCAAVTRAGYHVEFAAGGYHSAASLRSALYRLRDLMPVGRGITVNVIYINPKAIAWQIPLIRDLRSEGFPITGLTVGGGVPSVEVASEYISTLGVEHISFKPGSVGSIQSVVEIARRNPGFPVILQWTGGRGGGHHSYEDFHAPILETYGEVRKCDNIVLVAGSGFGSSEDVRPYLSGEWCLSHGRKTRMPFDGVLFGSRVMTCLEANTSPGAKAAIAAAPGVENERDWEKTYAGPAGGIVTVVSEMGEPIHVVATRGALFWAEMDKLVFKMEKTKRAAVLSAKKTWVVQRLNADFQKPWFGRKGGDAADLADMTYLEVLHRMVALMFVETRNRWIDPSYARFFFNFALRTQERLDADESVVSEQSCAANPSLALGIIAMTHPDAASTQLCTEDVHYFLQLCRRPGQKPVPFVPILDDNFETYFKKDSLWQSEDLDAVVGRDAGRTFILHGPVAAKSTCQVDEPVKEVLDGINNGVIRHLLARSCSDSYASVPHEEFLRRVPQPPETPAAAGALDFESLTDDQLRALLSGSGADWRSALFGFPTIARGHSILPNPVWKLVQSSGADAVGFLDGPEARISFYQTRGEGRELVLHITRNGREITVMPFTWVTATDSLVSLAMKFEYHPETPYAPIREVEQGREQRIYDMYRQLWLGDAALPSAESSSPESNVFEDRFTVERSRVAAFNRAVGYHKAHRSEKVPMDFAIVAAWKPISQALLQDPVQGDLLALVHLSNGYEVAKGAKPLDVGEEICTRAYVSAITIDDSGKTVEVACDLRRAATGERALTVRSRFLFRGSYDDFASTFARNTKETFEVTLSAEDDVAVLTSKPWFNLHSTLEELEQATLEFHLQTFARYQNKGVFGSLETTGKVYKRSEAGDLRPVGAVSHFDGACKVNSVKGYLARAGRAFDGLQLPLRGDAPVPNHIVEISIPPSNEAYSRASGDVNPIHTSPMFATLVDLPGTITHGMYCSAAVRGALEQTAAEQQPERIRKYDVSFVGMVLPGDRLEATFTHTAMQDGLKVVKIDVAKQTGEKVLAGSALVAQPATTIVFTGQGSQEKGMGMDLYESSPVARAVWDRADVYFRGQFGLSILDVVRRNPTSVKVHFGGVRGRLLRKNYMGMFYESPGRDGALERRPVFPAVTEATTSFTHASPNGLLFATQFAQPALTIMELAAFRDMQAAAVVDPDCAFAGHSLGEYAALAAITDFMPFERLLYIVFCRGMTMQLAVERDDEGRSDFGMVAVDPGRVGKGA